ncbi:MAG: DUF429 domain-containing protein [Acidobacteria bacterium]|nr:DUF429 domain-containing protein [Acidobacteriota bacterium]
MRIAAADWSVHPRKRWVCECVDGVVSAPRQVADAAALLSGDGPAVVGFDFPIGMPAAYCRAAGFSHFFECLRVDWTPSNHPALAQPFFPQTPNRKMAELEAVLGIARGDWLRECDRLAGAAPMFWTLGAKQVGKAAISGWKEVLRARPEVWKIWPFEAVDVRRDQWVAEIYPALGYPKNFGKRNPARRREYAGELLARAAQLQLRLTAECETAVQDGFGPHPDGEDPFDAFVGLVGMAESLGDIPSRAPLGDQCEGWILGLPES